MPNIRAEHRGLDTSAMGVAQEFFEAHLARRVP